MADSFGALTNQRKGDVGVFDGVQWQSSGALGMDIGARIVGPQAVLFAGAVSYGFPTVEGRRLTIVDGSTSRPVTNGTTASVVISRDSSITSGIDNGAVTVLVHGQSTQTVQVMGLQALVEQEGSHDAVAIAGSVVYAHTGTHVGYGGYFQAEVSTSGGTGGAVPIGTGLLNNGGRSEAYNASPATMVGIDLYYADVAAGSHYGNSAVYIRASQGTGGLWDAGINIIDEPIRSYDFISNRFSIGTNNAATVVFNNYTPVVMNGTSGATLDFQVAGTTKNRLTGDANALYFSAVGALIFNIGVSGTGTEAGRFSNAGRLKLIAGSTGAGSAVLGANCPAVTLTAPYTWFNMEAPDGSVVYVPGWK